MRTLYDAASRQAEGQAKRHENRIKPLFKQICAERAAHLRQVPYPLPPMHMGDKKIAWRHINQMDYGKRYCHHSPSIEESLLQVTIIKAIQQTEKQNAEVLHTLKIHIGMGLTAKTSEDKTLDIQIRMAEIDAEFQKILKTISADSVDEKRIGDLMSEKQQLTMQLEQYAAMRQKRESAKSRLDEIYTILDGLKNHPMEYDDKLLRQE